ncbi:MAG: GspE family protein, partial [Janthinobacterium lividum]
LCPHCREPDPLAIAQRATCPPAARAAVDEGAPPAWRALGCDACHGIGYRGRMAIHEVMPVSARMRELIVGDASVVALCAQARAERIPSLQDAALAAVRAGRTSLDEAFGATGSDA